MATKGDLEILNERDIYSLSMFLLYKFIDNPNYSILGELPYILDKGTLFKFCNYFGGRTIKVPTLREIYTVLGVIQLYQMTRVANIDFNIAYKTIGFTKKDYKKIKEMLSILDNTLKDYKFDRGKND